ncbi:MAG: hypothetical protein AAFU33_16365 [Bacteroidota bacterium]
MAKRRQPSDPFGVSLLDVLSNALGGVILLVLIVAVTIDGNDKRRLNLPPEERKGINYTEINFDKAELDLSLNLLLIQIELIGGDGEIRLSGDSENCILTQTHRGSSEKKPNWLVIRTGENLGTWDISLKENSSTIPPNAVAIFITVDEKVYCSGIVDIQDVSTPLVTVVESKQNNPFIKVGDKTCPLNQKR